MAETELPEAIGVARDHWFAAETLNDVEPSVEHAKRADAAYVVLDNAILAALAAERRRAVEECAEVAITTSTRHALDARNERSQLPIDGESLLKLIAKDIRALHPASDTKGG